MSKYNMSVKSNQSIEERSPLTAGEVLTEIEKISDAISEVIVGVNNIQYGITPELGSNIFKKIEGLLDDGGTALVLKMVAFQNSIDLIREEIESLSTGDHPSKDMCTFAEIISDCGTHSKYGSESCGRSEKDASAGSSRDNYQSLPESYLHTLGRAEVLDILSDFDKALTENEVREHQEDKSAVEGSEIAFKHVLESFMQSEKNYHTIISSLNIYNDALLNHANYEKNHQLLAETNKLFAKIGQITQFHSHSLMELEGASGDALDLLVAFFTKLRPQLPVYKSHTLSNNASLEVLQRLRHLKGVSEILPKFIDQIDSKISFEDAIVKPNLRITEYYHILVDMFSRLSEDHRHFKALLFLRDEMNIYFEVTRFSKDKKGLRAINKWGPAVEYFGEGVRKHRILILITDYLVCAGENSKGNYFVKWYCSVKKMDLEEHFDETKHKYLEFIPFPKVHINEIREDIIKTKHEMSLLDPKKNSKKIEKLEKHCLEKMSELTLKFPSHCLRVYHPNGKCSLLLFMFEKSLQNWHRLIKIRRDSDLVEYKPINQNEVQAVVDSICRHYEISFKTSLPKGVLEMNVVTPNESTSNVITGKLFVNLLVLRNEGSSIDPIINVELDKHVKGYKCTAKNSKMGITASEFFVLEPEQAEGFMYITSSKSRNRPEDQLGALVLNLVQDEVLKKPFIKRTKEFKWGRVLIFVEFSYSAKEPQHILDYCALNPSVDAIARCEGLKIPSIISLSIEYVEKYGLSEVGIYRISGVSSKIAMLKRLWGEGWIFGLKDLEDFDVHVVAGNFKSFLRELKTSLIPDNIMKMLKEFDYANGSPEKFSQLLALLPPVNRSCLTAIFDHMVVVESNKELNKMTFQNLSTVIGVNVMKRADNSTPGMDIIDNNLPRNIAVFNSIMGFWTQYCDKIQRT